MTLRCNLYGFTLEITVKNVFKVQEMWFYFMLVEALLDTV